MKNRVRGLMVSLAILLGLLAPVAIPGAMYAVDDASSQAACDAIIAAGGRCSPGGTNSKGILGGLVGNIVSILIWSVGVIAIIVLLLGAYRYTTSAGDANKLKGAKDTIIYALIGIAVAVLAQVIVNITVNATNPPPEETPTPLLPGNES